MSAASPLRPNSNPNNTREHIISCDPVMTRFSNSSSASFVDPEDLTAVEADRQRLRTLLGKLQQVSAQAMRDFNRTQQELSQEKAFLQNALNDMTAEKVKADQQLEKLDEMLQRMCEVSRVAIDEFNDLKKRYGTEVEKRKDAEKNLLILKSQQSQLSQPLQQQQQRQPQRASGSKDERTLSSSPESNAAERRSSQLESEVSALRVQLKDTMEEFRDFQKTAVSKQKDLEELIAKQMTKQKDLYVKIMELHTATPTLPPPPPRVSTAIGPSPSPRSAVTTAAAAAHSPISLFPPPPSTPPPSVEAATKAAVAEGMAPEQVRRPSLAERRALLLPKTIDTIPSSPPTTEQRKRDALVHNLMTPSMDQLSAFLEANPSQDKEQRRQQQRPSEEMMTNRKTSRQKKRESIVALSPLPHEPPPQPPPPLPTSMPFDLSRTFDYNDSNANGKHDFNNVHSRINEDETYQYPSLDDYMSMRGSGSSQIDGNNNVSSPVISKAALASITQELNQQKVDSAKLQLDHKRLAEEMERRTRWMQKVGVSYNGSSATVIDSKNTKEARPHGLNRPSSNLMSFYKANPPLSNSASHTSYALAPPQQQLQQQLQQQQQQPSQQQTFHFPLSNAASTASSSLPPSTAVYIPYLDNGGLNHMAPRNGVSQLKQQQLLQEYVDRRNSREAKVKQVESLFQRLEADLQSTS